jgi:hypothetical protein
VLVKAECLGGLGKLALEGTVHRNFLEQKQSHQISEQKSIEKLSRLFERVLKRELCVDSEGVSRRKVFQRQAIAGAFDPGGRGGVRGRGGSPAVGEAKATSQT